MEQPVPERFQAEADRLGVPVIKPLPVPKLSNPGNDLVAVCGKCGMHIKRVMQVHCADDDCPTFPRVNTQGTGPSGDVKTVAPTTAFFVTVARLDPSSN